MTDLQSTQARPSQTFPWNRRTVGHEAPPSGLGEYPLTSFKRPSPSSSDLLQHSCGYWDGEGKELMQLAALVVQDCRRDTRAGVPSLSALQDCPALHISPHVDRVSTQWPSPNQRRATNPKNVLCIRNVVLAQPDKRRFHTMKDPGSVLTTRRIFFLSNWLHVIVPRCC